jgi:rod shape-determining protein MreD
MTPVTPHLVLRLLVLLVAVTVLQIAAISQVQIFGATADLLPLTVMAVALMCGSLTGATFGFFVGLFADTALVQTLGLSSLVYVAAGYAVGRVRELRDPHGTLVPFFAGAGATAIALIGYALMQFLLGVDAPVSLYLIRETLATIVLNTILAIPVYAVVRRWLMPALPDDPRRRRRRAYTTGGLSPLSRA